MFSFIRSIGMTASLIILLITVSSTYTVKKSCCLKFEYTQHGSLGNFNLNYIKLTMK